MAIAVSSQALRRAQWMQSLATLSRSARRSVIWK